MTKQNTPYAAALLPHTEKDGCPTLPKQTTADTVKEGNGIIMKNPIKNSAMNSIAQNSSKVNPNGKSILYTIFITDKDGTTSTITTRADSADHAHRQAKQGITITDTYGNTHTIKAEQGATIRAYATTQDRNGAPIAEGIQAGALTVVKRTTANMMDNSQ